MTCIFQTVLTMMAQSTHKDQNGKMAAPLTVNAKMQQQIHLSVPRGATTFLSNSLLVKGMECKKLKCLCMLDIGTEPFHLVFTKD